MLLAFEVVLFGGLAFMFFCILRNQDSMLKTMREEHGAILSTLFYIISACDKCS